MKFLQQRVLCFFLVSVGFLKSGSINLTPNDEAQYGNYFNDRNNILTVSPEEFSFNNEKNEKNLQTNFNEKKLDPSFKAIMQDITDNSHFLTADTKEESNFLLNNQENNYKKQIEESVNNEINEIARESREETLREKNQEMQDIYMNLNENHNKPANKNNNNFLKQPRFLEKNSILEGGQNIYDPTGLGIMD